MKKYTMLLLLAGAMIAGSNAFSQRADSSFVNKYVLDFVVPDMPAFKAMDMDPSNLLRPSDVKKFAAMISPFYSGGKAVIPKNFAVEFAPWKIASTKWTLNDYKTSGLKRFLYRSSFSLGTMDDSSSGFSSSLSVGYRVSILSRQADILRAAEIRNNIYNGRFLMDSVMGRFTELTNYWVNVVVQPDIAERPVYYQQNRDAFAQWLSTVEEQLAASPNDTLHALFHNFILAMTASDPERKYTADELSNIIQVLGANIDAFIEAYKENNWNATRFDAAMAWVGQSNSELLSGLNFGKFALWLTGAFRAHKGGQFLLGGNLTLPRSLGKDSSRLQYSVSMRYFAGTQHFRGFVETQYKYNRYELDEKSLLLNLGAEFRIGGSFWVVLGAGVDNYLGLDKPVQKLVSSIDLRYGFNK